MNNRRTVVWTTAGPLTLVIMLMAVTGVWAESPKTDLAVPSAPLAVFSDTVSFQGRLLDNAGNPVDGSPIMTFRLYAQAEGGAPVHQRDRLDRCLPASQHRLLEFTQRPQRQGEL